MPATSCSLIISTFNRPDALQRCIESVWLQTRLPDEVIIADDGSRPETKNVVDSLTTGKVPVVHVWQPDNGYQLARIRNKAFIAARGEYLVQMDGDLVLHTDFLRHHIQMARKGTFVSGARVNMDETLTARVLQGVVPLNEIGRHPNHLQKKYNGWDIPLLSRLNYLIQRSANNYKHVLGCNMAFWKADLVKVNGYNEDFTGWGKEDNDLAIRLINAGVQLRFVKYGAIMYHMAHKVADLSYVPENEQLLEKSRAGKITFVSSGMSQHQ